MKLANDKARGVPPPIPKPEGAESDDAETTEPRGRSAPLKNTYNLVFIAIVLSIAAILALILVFWPSSGL